MCPSGESPVYKLVFFQVLATLCDVPSDVEKVHHSQAGRVLLITEAQKPTLATTSEARLFCTNLDEGLTGRGRVSLMKVLRSPPVISSSRINLGIACRLTPTHLTMFWWLNLLQGQKRRKKIGHFFFSKLHNAPLREPLPERNQSIR